MKWYKQGRIFKPSGDLSWMASHAALPVALHVEGERFRVFCSGRNRSGQAQIGFFEVNLTKPREIMAVSEEPVVALGPLGAYDDSGVTSSWVVKNEGTTYLYYTGWSLGVTVPFYLNVGLATSQDGGKSFVKVSDAPILGRRHTDPFLTASPCVLVEDGLCRMWYVSGLKWVMERGTPKHYYHIRYAESGNGIDWKTDGRICIDFRSQDEYAFGRPTVIRDEDTYKMWYSYRGERYRIGYAESPDGFNWVRKDRLAGMGLSKTGWDSEMVAYPYVFDHGDIRYILYNGNQYGGTGIGLASQDRTG